MLDLFFNIYRHYRLEQVKKTIFSSTTIGKNSIVSSSASVKLLYGSNKDDINIGDCFKITGELISSHHGKIKIGNNCLLGPNCVIGAVNQVLIGDGVWISNNVVIIDNNNHPVNPIDRMLISKSGYDNIYRSWKYAVSKPIIICDNVWIGRNSIINKGVTIGENSIVAAGSIVTKNVPANCIVAGNPAKIVKTDLDKEPILIANNGEL